MEHRMRCKVCGKIWCFTDQDLKKNSSNSLMSGIAAIGGIASVLGGTTAQQHLNYDIMERNQAKVVDYYQCPNCRSKDVVELSEEEWEEVQTQESFANARVSVNANATTEALLTRIKLLLEDKDWPNANAYCDAVLDAEPESAMAYVYKLMAELRVSKQADLANHKVPFDTKPNYQKAVRFADDSLRQMLNGYIAHINERNERERLDGLYNNACAAMQQSATEEAYKNAASLFAVIKGHKDADNLQAECLRKAEQARLEAERKATEEKAAAAEQAKKMKKIAMIVVPIVVAAIVAAVLISNFVKAQQEEAARLEAYNAAVALAEAGQYDEAIAAFTELGDYRDSAEQINETTYNQAVALLESGNYNEAISIFTRLGNYKDSEKQISVTNDLKAEADLLNTYESAISLLNTEFGTTWSEMGEYYEAIAQSRELLMSLNGYRDSDELLQHFYENIIGERFSSQPVHYYQYDSNGKLLFDTNYYYTYDADGKITAYTDNNFNFTVVSYDDKGRMTRAENTEKSLAVHIYSYDTNGQLTKKEWQTPYSTSASSYYYADGRLTQSTYSSEYGGESQYTYRYVDYAEYGTSLPAGTKNETIYLLGWIYAPNANQ